VNAARFVRQLAALHDRELRARRAAALLAELAPGDAISLLAALVDHARGRAPPASAALEGALRGCHLHLDAITLASFCAEAEAAERLELVALLRDCAAARNIASEREGFIDREMRARTLGERKQLARSRDRDLLARLASDPDPSVLRALLQNPRVTEREVLIAASRRPTRAVLLEEIYRSARWSQNRRVRRALALNPYSPPTLAVTQLSSLTAPDLLEVAGDASLSTVVRVQARRMLAARSSSADEKL
jgi:hypothetical protein